MQEADTVEKEEDKRRKKGGRNEKGRRKKGSRNEKGRRK